MPRSRTADDRLRKMYGKAMTDLSVNHCPINGHGSGTVRSNPRLESKHGCSKVKKGWKPWNQGVVCFSASAGPDSTGKLEHGIWTPQPEHKKKQDPIVRTVAANDPFSDRQSDPIRRLASCFGCISRLAVKTAYLFSHSPPIPCIKSSFGTLSAAGCRTIGNRCAI